MCRTTRFASLSRASSRRALAGTGRPIPGFSSCRRTARNLNRIAFAAYIIERNYYRILWALATVIYLRVARRAPPIRTTPDMFISHFIIFLAIILIAIYDSTLLF